MNDEQWLERSDAPKSSDYWQNLRMQSWTGADQKSDDPWTTEMSDQQSPKSDNPWRTKPGNTIKHISNPSTSGMAKTGKKQLAGMRLHPNIIVEPPAAGGRKRKGTGLERICKGMGVKLTIEIPPGLKRPEKPLPAAKFASEGGMLARGQMPLLPHFKLYKRDENLLADFVGKMGANFNMDTESEDIQKACYDVLRKVSKNRRYILKRDYFDKVPANEVSIKSPVKDVSDEEWEALTALWVTPRHRNTCTKNKDSRAAVKFGQKTGSRSYAAHLYATREERRGEELDAVDIFKATHHSKKDGFSEEALAAIADMEAEMAIPVPEGAPPRSAVAVVAKVLSKEAKHSTFLKNAGLQPSSTVKLNKPTAAAVSAHVHDPEARLKRSREEAERDEAAVCCHHGRSCCPEGEASGK
nr:uncharacterized protein LOC127303493 [Lolium perenne]